MRVTANISDESLDDPGKIALYGRDAIEAERALRQRARQRYAVDLRGADEGPIDPWEAARRAANFAGETFDPIREAGLHASNTAIGGSFDREVRARAELAARQTQRVRWRVTLGTTIVLRSGARLTENQALTAEHVDHPRSGEIIGSLVERGFVSEISEHDAWLWSLPPSVGPYVCVVDGFSVGGKTLRRGASVAPEDFEPAAAPRTLSDGDTLATVTLGQLQDIVLRWLMPYVPAIASCPPPASPFELATRTRAIVSAPNFDPSTRAAAGARIMKGK